MSHTHGDALCAKLTKRIKRENRIFVALTQSLHTKKTKERKLKGRLKRTKWLGTIEQPNKNIYLGQENTI